MIDRRTFIKGLAGSAAVASVPGCTYNPATGRQTLTGFYSVADDIRLGRKHHPKILKDFGGEYRDKKLSAYVGRIGRELARHVEYDEYPYRFTILDSPIANAFAVPGGFVYITRGLLALANNEAEIAGILGHELGHVNARHVTERLSQQGLVKTGLLSLSLFGGEWSGLADVADFGMNVLLKGFSRKQEYEADHLGVRYMANAGYDPEAMVTFLKTLMKHARLEARVAGRPEDSVDVFDIMSTHPRTEERVRKAIQDSRAQRPASPVTQRRYYVTQLDGLLYGHPPSEGVVRENTFYHTALGFAFSVPPGFRIVNGAKQVTAVRSDGTRIVFDMGLRERTPTMLSYIRNEWMPKAGLYQLDSFEINGMEAAAATAYATDDKTGKKLEVRLVAIEGEDADVFRFVGMMPSNSVPLEVVEMAPRSFRRLAPDEAMLFAPLRVRFVPVRPDDTAEGFAALMPFGDYSLDYFYMLNAMEPGAPLTPGKMVKVVS